MAIVRVSCLQVPEDKAEAGISLGRVSLGPGRLRLQTRGSGNGEKGNVLFVPGAPDAKTTAR